MREITYDDGEHFATDYYGDQCETIHETWRRTEMNTPTPSAIGRIAVAKELKRVPISKLPISIRKLFGK